MNRDEEHLKLLSIFHYVVGGIAAFFAFFPIIHLVIGIACLREVLKKLLLMRSFQLLFSG